MNVNKYTEKKDQDLYCPRIGMSFVLNNEMLEENVIVTDPKTDLISAYKEKID
ncbi:hypothetical protein [Lacrimispora amygdalina]|uniref:hypothetical protein n=1 Tax=Lacrimispora amygdalina TaxID=253257 RepID=UPI00140BFAB4|nr:hypothetical protein [Lacrimispora amygdalina]